MLLLLSIGMHMSLWAGDDVVFIGGFEVKWAVVVLFVLVMSTLLFLAELLLLLPLLCGGRRVEEAAERGARDDLFVKAGVVDPGEGPFTTLEGASLSLSELLFSFLVS